MLRPHIRLPLWAAAALVAAAYVIGKLIRGERLTPTGPDAGVLLLAAIVLSLAAYLRATSSRRMNEVAEESEHEDDRTR